MIRTSEELCKEYELQNLEEKNFYKNISSRYARNSKYLDAVCSDIDYAISQARVYNNFTHILTKMVYELNHKHNDIKLCDFIENNTLRMKDNIKEMSKKENNKVKVKNKDRYAR